MKNRTLKRKNRKCFYRKGTKLPPLSPPAFSAVKAGRNCCLLKNVDKFMEKGYFLFRRRNKRPRAVPWGVFIILQTILYEGTKQKCLFLLGFLYLRSCTQRAQNCRTCSVSPTMCCEGTAAGCPYRPPVQTCRQWFRQKRCRQPVFFDSEFGFQKDGVKFPRHTGKAVPGSGPW